MSFSQFHSMGGWLFMTVLSLSLTLIIATTILNIVRLLKASYNAEKQMLTITDIRDIGVFAIIWGIFGQSIGLFSALQALESSPDISPAMIYGGIKVSFITTLYGMLIFILSWLIYLAMRNWKNKTSNQS